MLKNIYILVNAYWQLVNSKSIYICVTIFVASRSWRNLDLNTLEYHRILRIYAFIKGLLYLIFSVNGENTIERIFYSKLKTENVLPWRLY